MGLRTKNGRYEVQWAAHSYPYFSLGHDMMLANPCCSLSVMQLFLKWPSFDSCWKFFSSLDFLQAWTLPTPAAGWVLCHWCGTYQESLNSTSENCHPFGRGPQPYLEYASQKSVSVLWNLLTLSEWNVASFLFDFFRLRMKTNLWLWKKAKKRTGL